VSAETHRYLKFWSLLDEIPYSENLRLLARNYFGRFITAKGSSNNHQVWEGGYLNHIEETMNIAIVLFEAFDNFRQFPFCLSDALVVLFLHDLEKPFKQDPDVETLIGSYNQFMEKELADRTGQFFNPKAARRSFRDALIARYDIKLTDAQKNALQYIEGVPDSEYTSSERTMGELAAFCHCCDVLSARVWHDKGNGINW